MLKHSAYEFRVIIARERHIDALKLAANYTLRVLALVRRAEKQFLFTYYFAGRNWKRSLERVAVEIVYVFCARLSWKIRAPRDARRCTHSPYSFQIFSITVVHSICAKSRPCWAPLFSRFLNRRSRILSEMKIESVGIERLTIILCVHKVSVSCRRESDWNCGLQEFSQSDSRLLRLISWFRNLISIHVRGVTNLISVFVNSVESTVIYRSRIQHLRSFSLIHNSSLWILRKFRFTRRWIWESRRLFSW